MSDPLWEQMLVSATGPTVAAALALLVVNRISARVQSRRDDYQTKETLVTEITELVGPLSVEMDRLSPIAPDTNDPDYLAARELLDKDWLAARPRFDLVLARLALYYSDRTAARAWARLLSLMRVRYLYTVAPEHARDRMIEMVSSVEAGPQASGLSREELQQPAKVGEAMRRELTNVIEAIWAKEPDRRGKLEPWKP